MRKETSYLSMDGKTLLHGWRYTPSEHPKAVLLISHGMNEYIDRYAPFAEWLSQRGWAVYGHDHLGHGASVRSEKDWGYFGEQAHPMDLLVEDIHTMRKLAEKDFPGLPVFLLGHSMGSFVVRKYIILYGAGLSGCAIVGTGWMSAAVTGGGKAVLKLLTRFQGSRARSSFASGLTFGGKDYKAYDTTGTDPTRSWLTKDVDIVKRYFADPRCTYTFTLNGFYGLVDCVSYVCKPTNIAKTPKELPLYITSGSEDPVGAMGKGPTAVAEAFRRAGCRDVTLKLYPGDRHEILNETDRDQVWLDFAQWFESKLP